ncbi:hypothetical protein NI17_011355 [Thermobifida halotolerans]|uniref:Uncharacterized protein n=1 Tax=Thermobifida halotolerans TaxID=483545 RepID=A0A399G6J3_9ACTN|nr:hypothetical protein [Thermobifida halotolerans]UOE21636.1 hypothetical protein NI17_011355 [Thermobifida halotolerans]
MYFFFWTLVFCVLVRTVTRVVFIHSGFHSLDSSHGGSDSLQVRRTLGAARTALVGAVENLLALEEIVRGRTSGSSSRKKQRIEELRLAVQDDCGRAESEVSLVSGNGRRFRDARSVFNGKVLRGLAVDLLVLLALASLVFFG